MVLEIWLAVTTGERGVCSPTGRVHVVVSGGMVINILLLNLGVTIWMYLLFENSVSNDLCTFLERVQIFWEKDIGQSISDSHGGT